MLLENVVKLYNEKYIFSEDEIKGNNDFLVFSVIEDNLNKIFTNKLKSIILKIDFNLIGKDYPNIVKKIIKIKKKCKNKKIKIGIKDEENVVLGYLKNYNSNNVNQRDLITAINAIFYDNNYDRYNYLYDKICEYLDNEFVVKNLCNFENDKCIAKKNTSCTMGCCHHFKNKLFGPFLPNNLVLCEYLENKKCSAKCISCKLFTCDYLNKQGVKFKLNDILLIKCFFNFIQKLILKLRVFTPKEKIMKELLFFDFKSIDN